MCRSRLWLLYWVSTQTRRHPALTRLDNAKSTSRYRPPNGTAGLARSAVSGDSRRPAPPARTIPNTRWSAITHLAPGRSHAVVRMTIAVPYYFAIRIDQVSYDIPHPGPAAMHYRDEIRLPGIHNTPAGYRRGAGIHRRRRPGQAGSTVPRPLPAGSCDRTPRHLRWRIIATVQLIAHRNSPGAFGDPRGSPALRLRISGQRRVN